MRRDTFADEIAATEAAHLGGVLGASWNVAALASVIDAGLTVHGKSHFATQNDVSGFGWMSMSRVVRIWAVSPCVGVRETFVLKLC